MPGRGLEPLRISPPDPKSGASANFATLAKQFCTLPELVKGATSHQALVAGLYLTSVVQRVSTQAASANGAGDGTQVGRETPSVTNGSLFAKLARNAPMC